MFEIFEQIKSSDENKKKIVLTVLDKENLGEKAFIINGKIIWESKENGFFSAKQEEVSNLLESGEIFLDGKSVFCDVLGKQPKLIICGAGHVSIPVIKIGVMIGFEVIVLEDRPFFADNARKAGASLVLCEDFTSGLEKIEGDIDTYFVIVTRGHRYDQICLEKIAKKKHAYIGMIGSRRRTSIVKEQLILRGVNEEVINAVYTPIGLNIGAKTPEEIAVAIIAELIEVKSKTKRTYGYSKEMIDAILNKEWEKKVLATIVRRKGSAPQDVGVKMLINRNGKCVGTIGGGCMEAQIIQKAIFMMSEESNCVQICHISMLANEAEEEGMVCGGTVDVLLEKI